MADRYWVGGAAAWDGTAGTKWATTSGGAGGASVPTAADAVFFTNLSTGPCTISTGNTGAASINCTGFTGTIAGTAAITVSGSVTLSAAMTWNHSGTMTFDGTGTLITSGKTFSAITVNGVGITLTLGGALNVGSRSITVTQGTFTTAGFTVSAGGFFSSNSNTRTINLSNSTINMSGFDNVDFLTSTNLTFNAGTSQLNLAGNAPLYSTGLTFHNVSYTATSSTNLLEGTGNVFNNLLVTAPSSAGMVTFFVNGNQTINGTFTCAGASAVRRVFVARNVIGTISTLTVAALSANDCDFRDIIIAGAAAGAAPTRAGNCGGNGGITFPAAKTVYRVGTNTTWPGSSSWALSSGGTGADTNFPLAQDTAVIDNSTALTGTLTLAAFNISALNASTRTTGITLSHALNVNRYGSYILGSGITVSGTSTQTFAGRGTIDINTAGKTITFPLAVNAPGGTFRLQAAFTMSTGVALTHTNGTIDFNGFTLTVGTSYTTAAGTKNLTFNGGMLTCPAGGLAFNNGQSANFTTTAGTGTGTINMTAAGGKTFAGGGSTFNCTLTNGGAGALTITGSNTFTALSNSVQPTSFLFTAGTTTTLTTWNISGTVGNLVTIGSPTAASHTLSKASGTVDANYLSISRSTATGGATWNAGANSTNGGNNSGWIFGTPPPGPSGTGNFFLLIGGG